VEQIFIKRFNLDDGNWSNSIKITESPNDKLYLDTIKDKEGNFHITYSEYIDGNFEIVHKKVSLYNNYCKSIKETKLSNPANSSYPTIIYYKEKIWISWVEFNHLVSCYSENLGENWSNPYIWKDSKRDNFLRYRYLANRKTNNVLNFSFGKEPPSLTFMGFGPLEDTEEVPLIDKKKEELDSYNGNIVIDESINKKNENKDLNRRYVREKEKDNIEIEKDSFKEDISEINKKVNSILDRLDKLEKQVFRRRRPF